MAGRPKKENRGDQIMIHETDVSPSQETFRTDRKMQSRNWDDHSKREQRKPISFSLGSRFNIQEHVKEEGYSYAYIPYNVGGEEKRDLYFEAIDRRGFEPVKASSHPDLARRYDLSPFKRREEDEFIHQGGQILMRRLEEYKKAEDEFYDERNSRNNHMVEMRKMGNPTLKDERRIGAYDRGKGAYGNRF